MKNELKKISKALSYILRHKPEKFNIKLDKNGWAKVDEILDRLETNKELLIEVVETNDKKRFAFNEDMTSIRASQGHSIDVDVELKKCVPPFTLYHGTKKQFVDTIKKDGLKSMNRQYVHLSKDTETAEIVAGRRSGDDVILEIQARAMYADNVDIYLSENGVYLVKDVDAKYIS